MTESTLRDTAREATWTPCLVRVDRETILRGLITNISPSGAELRCKFPFESQQKIDLVMPSDQSRQSAFIVRGRGNKFGIRWDQD